MQLTGYHGTDACCAEKIVKNGFQYKRSSTHWLGNGVYFYIDKALAKWWTTNPSSTYGVTVSVPVIIESIIEANDDNICDMRLLDDFQFVQSAFEEFWKYFSAKIKASGIRSVYREQQVRCAFFDWLIKAHSLAIVIGTFQKKNPKYKNQIGDKDAENWFLSMDIVYTEVQICVYTTSVISHITVLPI